MSFSLRGIFLLIILLKYVKSFTSSTSSFSNCTGNGVIFFIYVIFVHRTRFTKLNKRKSISQEFEQRQSSLAAKNAISVRLKVQRNSFHSQKQDPRIFCRRQRKGSKLRNILSRNNLRRKKTQYLKFAFLGVFTLSWEKILRPSDGETQSEWVPV